MTTYRYRETTQAALAAKGFRPLNCSVDALRETVEDGATRTIWERVGLVRGRVIYRSTLLRRVGDELHVITRPDATDSVLVLPGGRGRTIPTVTR